MSQFQAMLSYRPISFSSLSEYRLKIERMLGKFEYYEYCRSLFFTFFRAQNSVFLAFSHAFASSLRRCPNAFR